MRATPIGTLAAPRDVMRSIGFGVTLIVSAVLLLVVWLVSKVVGFDVSLLGSFGLTVLLTIILNVVLAAVGRRHRRF